MKHFDYQLFWNRWYAEVCTCLEDGIGLHAFSNVVLMYWLVVGWADRLYIGFPVRRNCAVGPGSKPVSIAKTFDFGVCRSTEKTSTRFELLFPKLSKLNRDDNK